MIVDHSGDRGELFLVCTIGVGRIFEVSADIQPEERKTEYIFTVQFIFDFVRTVIESQVLFRTFVIIPVFDILIV